MAEWHSVHWLYPQLGEKTGCYNDASRNSCVSSLWGYECVLVVWQHQASVRSRQNICRRTGEFKHETFSRVKCQQTFLWPSRLLHSCNRVGAIKHIPVPCTIPTSVRHQYTACYYNICGSFCQEMISLYMEKKKSGCRVTVSANTLIGRFPISSYVFLVKNSTYSKYFNFFCFVSNKIFINVFN